MEVLVCDQTAQNHYINFRYLNVADANQITDSSVMIIAENEPTVSLEYVNRVLAYVNAYAALYNIPLAHCASMPPDTGFASISTVSLEDAIRLSNPSPVFRWLSGTGVDELVTELESMLQGIDYTDYD